MSADLRDAEIERLKARLVTEHDIATDTDHALQARDTEIERLKAVAAAAHEVWWDHALPSRWFEDGKGNVLKDHSDALKEALKAVGYTMRLKHVTHHPDGTTEEHP